MRPGRLSPLRVLALSVLLPSCADGASGVPRHDAGTDARPTTNDGGDDAATATDGGVAPTVTIFQIQDPARPGHVPAGAWVRVEGALVAAVDAFEENGAGLGHLSDVWIADPGGGAFSGVHVYMPAHVPCAGRTTLAVGDTVDVEGTIAEFAVPSDGSGRTVTQLTGGTVTCTAAGDGSRPAPERVPDPATLTGGAMADEAMIEPWEGVLVELSDVEASAAPDRFGTLALRVGPPIDDDLYRHPGTVRDRFVTVRGVLHYMFGRWALYPRAASDVVLGEPRVLEDESGAWGCADGADSDGDTAIDCADADCASSLFCRGVTVRVQDLQDTARPAHPAAGTDVGLVGPLVVTAFDDFAEMAGPGYTGTVVVQDPDAADARHAGLHVFVPTIEPCGATLALGDRVYVAGRYEEYAEAGDTGGTLTELRNGIVSCRMPGAPLAPTMVPAPTELASAASAEPWEGVLVQIADVTVTMAPGTYGRFQVTGGAFVDDDLYRASVALGDRLSRVAGIVTYQFEPQLEPRSAADVVLAPTERDDASCGNGLDDDGDGASDCSDLDCCAAAPCAGAARRLILSEVLYDAASTDDGNEWVELRNTGSAAIPLACYALGSGPVSYRYSTAQLPAIVVPAGGCVLIGGPSCAPGTCSPPVNFEPDLHNGPSGTPGATGLALFYGLVESISAASVPVDAVLYGTTNAGMLRDATGAIPAMANAPDVTAGHSIHRSATGAWIDQTTPSPGTCTTYSP